MSIQEKWGPLRSTLQTMFLPPKLISTPNAQKTFTTEDFRSSPTAKVATSYWGGQAKRWLVTTSLSSTKFEHIRSLTCSKVQLWSKPLSLSTLYLIQTTLLRTSRHALVGKTLPYRQSLTGTEKVVALMSWQEALKTLALSLTKSKWPRTMISSSSL